MSDVLKAVFVGWWGAPVGFLIGCIATYVHSRIQDSRARKKEFIAALDHACLSLGLGSGLNDPIQADDFLRKVSDTKPGIRTACASVLESVPLRNRIRLIRAERSYFNITTAPVERAFIADGSVFDQRMVNLTHAERYVAQRLMEMRLCAKECRPLADVWYWSKSMLVDRRKNWTFEAMLREDSSKSVPDNRE